MVATEDSYRLFILSHVDQQTGVHRSRDDTYKAFALIKVAFAKDFVNTIIKHCNDTVCVKNRKVTLVKVAKLAKAAQPNVLASPDRELVIGNHPARDDEVGIGDTGVVGGVNVFMGSFGLRMKDSK